MTDGAAVAAWLESGEGRAWREDTVARVFDHHNGPHESVLLGYLDAPDFSPFGTIRPAEGSEDWLYSIHTYRFCPFARYDDNRHCWPVDEELASLVAKLSSPA